MSDNELLLAISDLVDKKLKPLKDDMEEIKEEVQGLKTKVQDMQLHLENVTDANIQLLVENYVPAAKVYQKETARIDAMQADIDIMKEVIREHSEILKKIS